MKKSLLLAYTFFLKSLIKFKRIGRHSLIKFPFKIWNSRYLEIGSNVFIAENSFVAISKIDRNMPSVIIGNNVCIGSNLLIACVESVVIEDNVLMSDRVFISDHIHGYENIYEPIISQKLVPKGKVVIKKGSFVGINAVIMPGVTIGEHAVIGASAVVTKNVPAFSVVVGNPAKIIKRYNAKRKKWESVK